jgi:hypothetical protein
MELSTGFVITDKEYKVLRLQKTSYELHHAPHV